MGPKHQAHQALHSCENKYANADSISHASKQLINSFIRSGLLKTPKIISAFRSIKREDFVPFPYRQHAWLDAPLPIGHGATISAPHMYAIMLEAAHLKEGQKVLEIGAGSGYGAALIAYVVGRSGKVYSIERVRELAEFASKNIAYAGIRNAFVIHGDGKLGYAPCAPYARIFVTAECSHSTLQNLFAQLDEGGILLAPVRQSLEGPAVLRLYCKSDGRILAISELGPVMFVPLI